MTFSQDNVEPLPTKAGPNGDGSKSLAKESKAGVATTAVLTILVTGAVQWLSSLDTSSWSGWWVNSAVAGIAALAGLGAAWLKRNR